MVHEENRECIYEMGKALQFSCLNNKMYTHFYQDMTREIAAIWKLTNIYGEIENKPPRMMGKNNLMGKEGAQLLCGPASALPQTETIGDYNWFNKQ